MTEPMTAREQFIVNFATELDSAGEHQLASAIRTGTDNSHGGQAAIRAFERTIAAARGRLAQSGDVERIAEDVHEIYLATCRQRGLPIKSENAVPYAALSDVSKDQDRAIAHYVLATAEAARIEGGREGIEAAYATVKNLEGDAQDSRDADRRAGNFQSAQFYTDHALALASAMVAIRALRPDELEKKT